MKGSEKEDSSWRDKIPSKEQVKEGARELKEKAQEYVPSQEQVK